MARWREWHLSSVLNKSALSNVLNLPHYKVLCTISQRGFVQKSHWQRQTRSGKKTSPRIRTQNLNTSNPEKQHWRIICGSLDNDISCLCFWFKGALSLYSCHLRQNLPNLPNLNFCMSKQSQIKKKNRYYRISTSEYIYMPLNSHSFNSPFKGFS